jgi:hypothetical protein
MRLKMPLTSLKGKQSCRPDEQAGIARDGRGRRSAEAFATGKQAAVGFAVLDDYGFMVLVCTVPQSGFLFAA